MALSTVLDSLGIRKSWTLPESSNTEWILLQSCQALPPHSHSPHSLQNTNHLHPSLISTSVNPDIKHTHTHTHTVFVWPRQEIQTFLQVYLPCIAFQRITYVAIFAKSSPCLFQVISKSFCVNFSIEPSSKKEICSYQ